VIEELAVIVASDVDGIWVEPKRKSVCGQCAVKKGCGTGVLETILGKKPTQIEVVSQIPVLPGDQVVIGMKEQALLHGTFLVYALPLILMILGGICGQILGDRIALFNQLFNQEIMSIIFALLGFMCGYAMARHRINFRMKYNELMPVVLRQL
jgi:sigma-E factor negative regulatory protein RseC